MDTAYDRLKTLLQTLFQMDQADLDFGIYRIMNQKRQEINDFLDNQLKPQIKKELAEYQKIDAVDKENELKKQIQNAKALGVNPDEMPVVKKLKEELNQYQKSSEIEDEIFSQLVNFFNRYYDEGDFISKRRYKDNVYSIPYEGEEVKLYWANFDQYYIKTTENFSDYQFKISGNKTAHFRIKNADTEKDNNKETVGKERRFQLFEEGPITIDDNTISIYFTYDIPQEKIDQKSANKRTLDNLKRILPPVFSELTTKLVPTTKNPNRSLLEKHIEEYTARNTFDYFIHKDLGGFLRCELDFFIKNEMFHIDDIDTENQIKYEASLSKIKVFKRIALKIIQFLEQLENFQKKLWEKKKFIVETNWCMTIDKVDEKLYGEFVKSKEQIQEWIDLGFIEKDTKINVEYLKTHKTLVIDTKFYPELKYKLLAEFDNLDEQTDGLLIHSENWQALNLLHEKYLDKIRSIYIDPPFNLGESRQFLYKVNYKDSTWASLMFDRILISKSILNAKGNIFVRCDYNGNWIIKCINDSIFGQTNFRNELIINKSNKQGAIDKKFNPATETLFLYSSSEESPINPQFKKRVKKGGWLEMHSPKENTHSHSVSFDGAIFIAPKGRHWSFAQDTVNRLALENRIKITKKQYTDVYDKIQNQVLEYLMSENETVESNWTDIPSYSTTTGFQTENSEKLLARVIETGSNENDLVMDFFLGSGTTTAVAHNVGRKWIGIEMGEQFNKFIVPRMKKVLIFNLLKDKSSKSSGMFKYFSLESYEDTLNNLEVKKGLGQAGIFEADDAKKLQEDYMLSYMLDIDTKGSKSLLNIKDFDRPFDYKLKILKNNEQIEKRIDLPETFNYLIGLNVEHMSMAEGCLFIEGKKAQTGEKVLVIWRSVADISNEKLNEILKKTEYNPKDQEFDIVYVNGDNMIENIKNDDEIWKVQLIEQEFLKLMFS